MEDFSSIQYRINCYWVRRHYMPNRNKKHRHHHTITPSEILPRILPPTIGKKRPRGRKRAFATIGMSFSETPSI